MLNVDLPALHRGRQRVLEPMRFDMPRASLTAIIGPNGAGKSTLLRAVAGLGQEAAKVRHGRIALSRRDIGFLPQAFHVHSELSVLDCVLLGRREDIGWRVAEPEIDAAQRLLDSFSLGDFSDRPMRALSGGQQQRVLLVQRVYRGGALLALDEPTSALDMHHQLAALEALRNHAAQTGVAILMALHDLTLAARYCDRVILIAEGRMIKMGAPDGVLTRELVARYWQISPEFLADRDARMVIVPHATRITASEEARV